jgi:hypothetical protein
MDIARFFLNFLETFCKLNLPQEEGGNKFVCGDEERADGEFPYEISSKLKRPLSTT